MAKKNIYSIFTCQHSANQYTFSPVAIAVEKKLTRYEMLAELVAGNLMFLIFFMIVGLA